MSDGDIYELYTDGACPGNPGPGGIGVYLIFPASTKKKPETFYRGFHETTNNRMELKAGVEGLRLVRQRKKELDVKFGFKTVGWSTDSRYVADNIYQIPKWRKAKWIRDDGQPVLNKDLWMELEGVRNSLRILPGWASRDFNKEANRLAQSAAKHPTHTDHGYNPGRIGSSVGTSRSAPVFFESDENRLKIRIYKSDGQVDKRGGRCKIRFQIIEKGGKISENKYYIYAPLDIDKELHRQHACVIETQSGNIIRIIKDITNKKGSKKYENN
jgi:ribonuclease HI